MFHKSLYKLRFSFVLVIIVSAFTLLFYALNSPKRYSSMRTIILNFHLSKSVQPTIQLENIDLTDVSRCYADQRDECITYFPDILDHEHQPTPGKSIFFLETSCWKNGIATLNSRQACAIESAAQQNPDRDIFVLFGSPVGVKTRDWVLPQFMDVFKKYSNIHLRNMNIWRLSYGTPIFDWLKTNKLFQSKYLVEQMSDIFRVVALHKFGGLYLDLDVVVLKNLDYLGENFVGNDWYEFANNAVFHFNNYGIAKNVTERMMRKVLEIYNGKYFQAVGPNILTIVFSEICSSRNRTLWTEEKCSGLKIYPKEYFYTVQYRNITEFFETKDREKTLKQIENAPLIHTSNDVTKKKWYKVGEPNAYQTIAKEKCPGVYNNSTLI